MRIALLHYTKPPVVGGVERVVGELARELGRQGHEVSVWSGEEKAGFRKWAERRDEGGEAVIVHNVFTMPFDLGWTRELTAMAEGDRGRCWVNWVHDVAALNPAYAAKLWQERAPAAVTVAVSQVRAREWASVAGLREEEVTVIPNGVDAAGVLGLTERVAALAAERGLWESDLNLVQPARLVRRKNVELGVRVMAVLKGRGIRARLVVTGAPDPHQGDGRRYFEELQALVAELGVGSEVVLAGSSGVMDDADVRGLYALCDGLFFPSRSEGFGLPLLEARLHRMPVWCSDLPVHRAVMGSEAEWLEPEEPASGLAERMIRWSQADGVARGRRQVWREHDWGRLCKERLVPLLEAGIKKG